LVGGSRLIRGDIPRDGASLDWEVLNANWSCRFDLRLVNGAEKDVLINGCGCDVGEIGWWTEEEDWAVVTEDNLGRLKQVRRIKWRELDFDGRTTPGLESSAKNKIKHFHTTYSIEKSFGKE
jgi:hypothetical protein